MKTSARFHFKTGIIRTVHLPLVIKYLGTLMLVLLINQQTASAWNLELGVHHLMPKLWTGEQKYENSSGSELKFKPLIKKTITGQSASISFVYENFALQLEQVAFQIETDVPAAYAALTNETTAKINVTEQRVGVNYHIERELAGLFAGFGMTREEEKLTVGGDEWIYEADVPFAKIGIDMILGAWRVRIEQIHFSFGKHSVKVSSLGILLYL